MAKGIMILFATIACVGVATVGFAETSSNPPVSGVTADAGNQPKQQASSHQNESNKLAPNIVSSGNVSQKSSDHAENKTKDESSKWGDPATKVAIFGALVAFIQALIYWGQLRIMKSTLAQNALAFASSEQSATLAREALQLAERAELQITEIAIPPSNRLGENSKLQVKFKNFGRTTGTGCIANIRSHDVPSATLATIESILVPGMESSFDVNVSDVIPNLTEQKCEAINDGKMSFTVVIELSCTDIFNKRVETVFESKLNPAKRAFTYTAVRRKGK